MAFVLADRVQETTATAGTGPLALAGASPGFRTFGAVMATGDTTRYTVVDDAANAWETGVTTFTAGSPSTLSRSPAATSAGGTAPIALAGNPGTRVFIGPDAAYFATLAPLASPVLTAPTLSGTVTLNGLIACAATTGRKIDIYNDGATIYGFGLNDFEYCIFGGASSALTYRVGSPGAIDLAGTVVFRVTTSGINGTVIGADTPAPVTGTVVAATQRAVVGVSDLAGTAAIYFNAAAGQVKQFVFQSGGSIRWTIGSDAGNETGANAGSNFAFARWDDAGNYIGNAISINRATGLVLIPNVDLEGGTIDNTAIGNTTPAAARFTTLALTGSQTSKFVLIAPNAANGAPTWRQILSTDVSGLGTLATASAVSPPALGGTTPAAVTATTLTSTGYRYRSGATALTAAGTTQATATAITRSASVFTTVAAGAGAILPNLPPVTVGGVTTFAEIEVFNAGANALLLYPASGLSVNALAANAALSVAAGAVVRGVQHSTTNYRLG